MADIISEIIDNGLFETAVNLMDDDLREQVHTEMSPCSDRDFLTRYIELHKEKYNEDFTV